MLSLHYHNAKNSFTIVWFLFSPLVSTVPIVLIVALVPMIVWLIRLVPRNPGNSNQRTSVCTSR